VNIKKSILLRVRIAFLGMTFVSVLIVIKIWHLQFIQGDKWRKKSELRDVQFRKIQALRGNVYAADGSLLATSLPFYKVAFDPTVARDDVFKKDLDSLAFLISTVFKEGTAEEYKNEIRLARRNKKRYILLSNQKIDYQTRSQMADFPIFRLGKKGGVIFEAEATRFKPFSGVAARTVGYINPEQAQGAVGLEFAFNNALAGKNGQALFQRIAGGHWVPHNDGSYFKPENGLDIQTTLDIGIQDIAHTSLYEAMQENQADFGCVIVMEVATGEIKAMANLGKNDEGTYVENYNYAIGDKGSTDPGSVFKLASMMALLENKSVKLSDAVETGDGVWKYAATTLNDPKRGGFGTLTVQEVFEKSSSIGIGKLVVKNFGDNPQKFINYLAQFGLKDNLHFQLAGETRPYIKNTNDPTWSLTSLPWMSIGYEMSISPLQMLVFYNAVANNGKLIQPILVKYIKEGDEVLEEFNSVTLREKICSDSTLVQLKSLLEGVVERGTARAIKTDKYRIVGKTSTSQKFKNGRYTKSYHTSFAGYFPAEMPKYSCIVVIDNPRGENQSGGDAAAPVFRKVADKLFAKDLELHKKLKISDLPMPFKKIPVKAIGRTQELKQVYQFLGIDLFSSEKDSEWSITYLENDGKTFGIKGLEQERNFMPDLRGMTLRDALYISENIGLKVKFEGRGKVVSQSIAPKKAFGIGRTLDLVLR
jgi:cell division protein FtsI (penicillin-binding protein 3)